MDFNPRLSDLLEKANQGVATTEDYQEIRAILASDQTGEVVEQVHVFYQAQPDLKKEKPYDTDYWDPALREILKADRVVEEKPVRRMYFLRRYAAAAAILIGLGIGAYFYFHTTSREITKTEKQPIKNDVLPGGNKAVLTLASGQQIILDSAHNGQLAIEKNVSIFKTDSGKLSYNVNGQTENDQRNVYNTLATPRGGQYQLQLPDGSEVWLNSASSIKYPVVFTEKERKVEITGEVYFEVRKDKTKPFHVKVNDMDVLVLGTHFNINSYDDEGAIKTTLLEGSVKISKGSEVSQILQPGQQAQEINGKIKIVEDANIEQVMAWKNGLFNFDGADLQTVLRQLGRWYDVDVVLEGSVSIRKFGGEISKDLNLSQVLKLLEKMEVKFRIEGKKLIVMP